jgi:YfiH family protein
MAEFKKWLKRSKDEKKWYEFSFDSKVKIFQGTKLFNPLREIKGDCINLIQIHSSVIHEARYGIKLVGDGLYTNKKGLKMYIRTADCLSIAFYHPGKEILSLLHSGWKGTVLMIAKKFLLKMEKLYDLKPEDWEVALGPCIDFKYYEVGKEVIEFFDKFNIEGIKIKNDRYFLDLEEANTKLIKKYGVSKIYPFPEKTYTSELFYSYRRGDTPRNITSGVIEP